MALSQRLVLKQGQSLVMTPQLQQAIKLLQMSSLELQSFVDAELERNPLLERDEVAETVVPGAASESETPALDNTFAAPGTGGDSPTSDVSAEFSDGSAGVDEKPVVEGPQDSNWSSLRGSGSGGFDGDADDMMSLVTRELTLSEHLTGQLNLHVEGRAERAIAHYLIGMVNEAGYLTTDLPAVAGQLGCTLDQLHKVLTVLKTFEPTGVFAEDLSECLKLQLKERDRLDPAMDMLVSHLDLVAKRDFNRLKTLCKVGLDDIRDMVAELKTLNPKPGIAFGSDPVVTVIPDVSVRAAPDGTWIVELNSDALPRVLMNNRYMATVVKGAKTSEDKSFLSEAQAQANWLIKSLDQRARTILRVSREIVAQQDGFFVHGVQHLRPLTLKVVAESVQMHESTISRVTSNKYMSTPRGLFELKFFFTNAISAADGTGDGHSSESVRHRIREMISRESADAVLSDDVVVEMLRHEGIEIARRTVAKYRESLNIPSSVQRRREARFKS